MPQDRLGLTIKKIELKCNKITNQLLLPYGLSPSQFRVLRWLFKKSETTPRQHDIEKTLTMSNPTVTGILNNLEKNGWINRLPHPEDKRSKHIALTEKSWQHQEILYQISNEIDDILTKSLTTKEREQLQNLLLKILE